MRVTSRRCSREAGRIRGLFPEAEHLHGDRERDLAALDGRTSDAVVDTSTHRPGVARLSANALRDRVGRYLYISSISAYGDLSTPPVEGAPTASEPAEEYGPLKAASEREVEHVFGDRALIIRPGLIVGPHDPTGRFTYWPHRLARGGNVLAPGSPEDEKQFIDVRDLAEWMLRMLEREAGGIYNATGEPIPFGRLLEACEGDAQIVWMPSERLVAAGVGEWMVLVDRQEEAACGIQGPVELPAGRQQRPALHVQLRRTPAEVHGHDSALAAAPGPHVLRRGQLLVRPEPQVGRRAAKCDQLAGEVQRRVRIRPLLLDVA